MCIQILYKYFHDAISKKLKIYIRTNYTVYVSPRTLGDPVKNSLYHNLLSIFSLNLFSSLAILLSRPNFAALTWVGSFVVSFPWVPPSARDPKSSCAVAVGLNEATRTSLYFVWTCEQQMKITLIQL